MKGTVNDKPLVFAERFKKKIAVVTGGASGIGRSCVEELCKEGAAVVFSGISDAGTTTEKELVSSGYNVKFLRGDMIDEEFCKKLVDHTIQEFGTVHYLINNAFAFTAKALDAERQDWERSYFVGPVGYATMIRLVAEPMKKSGGGSIVNVSSISGHIAQKSRWTYNMSKGAVNQLTKCAALDLAPFNIRINSVSPGWIWTREVEKAADMDGGGREKYGPIWGSYHMAERLGEARECARPILFLLSDDASFITATDLPIDSGYQSMGPEALGKTAKVAGSD